MDNSHSHEELLCQMEEMTSYLQAVFQKLASSIVNFKQKIQSIRKEYNHNQSHKRAFPSKTRETQFKKANEPPQHIPFNDFSIQIDDDDFLELGPLLIESDILEGRTPHQQNALWAQFRDIQMAKIKKGKPTEEMYAIDQFILEKWKLLSPTERQAQVKSSRKKQQSNMNKLLKKQKMLEYNESVKERFDKLLQKKSKRQMMQEKAEIKQQAHNQPKVNVSDLLASIEKSRSLQQKVERIFE